MQSNRRLRSGVAFLIAAAGLGLCGYAGLLWREQPHYSDAEIEKSVELNLMLDLAREGLKPDDLDKITLNQRRHTMRTEVESDIGSEIQPVKVWLIAGLTLLLFAFIQTWLARRQPR